MINKLEIMEKLKKINSPEYIIKALELHEISLSFVSIYII